MKDLLLSLNLYFGAVPGRLRPHRWKIVLFAICASLFLSVSLFTRFEMDVTFDSWFDDNDPVIEALDEFRRQFGSDDGLFIVYEPKDGNVFSAQSLALIQQLTDEFDDWEDKSDLTQEQIDAFNHIQRVQSLTNIRVQVNDQDTLLSNKLVPDTVPTDPAALADIAAIADKQKNLQLFMVSPNHRFAAINIQTDFGAIPKSDTLAMPDVDEELSLELDDAFDEAFDDFSIEVDESAQVNEVEFEDTDSTVYVAFMTEIKNVYGQEKYTEHFNFYPVGNPAMVDLAWDTMQQAGMLLLLMVFVVIALLWTLLRSASAVIWSLLAIVLSMLWVVGATLWMGVAISQMVSLTVMLVLAVGIADCVHVMSTYLYYRRHGEDHEGAMEHAYTKTGLPILLTTITTMAGMLALTITGMGQFVVFGFMSAAGVGMAFIFTVYLLPVLMDIWHPLRGKNASQEKRKSFSLGGLISAAWLQPLLDRIPAFVQKRPVTIAALFFGVFVGCLVGTTQVRIDTNLVEIYREGTTFRESYKIVDKEMMGTGNMTIMIDMNASDAFYDPEVLKAQEHLQQLVEEKYQQYILRTNSLADLVKDTNKIMNDDLDTFYQIPNNATAVSQLLYLFNSANPKDRRALVSDDYSRSHITINLRNAGSYEYSLFFEEIQVDIDQTFQPLSAKYPDMEVSVTGTLAMMMRLMDDISTSQFKSLALAMVIISVLLMVTLGSLQAGMLGIIPNLIPAIFTFGIMGWLGIPLDTDTLMIAPLIIGIAVDDTIHFITHYRVALAKTHDMAQALISTIKEVGQAITFTTLILGCGFFMLSFSDYLGLAKMGGFGALAVFVALLCDLLFLPALIMIFKPKFGQTNVDESLNFSQINTVRS